ncbi:MAG: hypothetical protein JWM93_3626 [Frankiales bacterium]|nr:hypothetical protein [Frankiales bacterium]
MLRFLVVAFGMTAFATVGCSSASPAAKSEAATPAATASSGAAATTTPTTTPTTRPTPTSVSPTPSATDALSMAEGTWTFIASNPAVTYVSGRFAGARYAVSNDRVTFTKGPSDTHSFGIRPDIVRETRVTCSPTQCTVGGLAFRVEGSRVKVLDRATLEPHDGAGVCGAPAAVGAGVATLVDAKTVTFLDAQTHGSGGDCYQVVHTITAHKAD